MGSALSMEVGQKNDVGRNISTYDRECSAFTRPCVRKDLLVSEVRHLAELATHKRETPQIANPFYGPDTVKAAAIGRPGQTRLNLFGSTQIWRTINRISGCATFEGNDLNQRLALWILRFESDPAPVR